MGTVKGRLIFDTSGFRRGAANVRRETRNLARSVKGAFTGVTARIAGLGTAFVGASAGIRLFREGITTIAEFGQEMANIRAITRGVTEQGFVAMEKAARNLGATTQFTAAQAAAAMRMLKQGGLSAREAVDQLPATLSLAAAGGLELEEAAEIAVKQFNTFKDQGTSVADVADILAVAASNSATNVQELSEGMKFASGISALFDKDLREVAATLGAMASVGLSGEIGGTALRNLLAELSSESSVAVRELKKYGVTFDEINPRANSLKDVFTTLTSNQGVLNNYTTIFNKRIMQGFGAIIANRDGFLDLLELLENSRGEAEKMASIRMDSLQGDFLRLKSAVQEVFLSAGVQDFFRAVTTQVTEVVLKIGRVVQAMRAAATKDSGKFFEILALAMRVAVGFFGNELLRAIRTAVAFLIGAFQSLKLSILDNNIVKAFGQLGEGLSMKIAAGIAAAAGKKEAARNFSDAGDSLFSSALGRAQLGFKTLGEDISNGIGDAFASGAEKAVAEIRKSKDVFGVGVNADRLKESIKGFRDATLDASNDALGGDEGTQKKRESIVAPPTSLAANPSRVGALAGAINTIFGRSVNSSILAVNEQQKKLLEVIAKNTAPQPTNDAPGEVVFA